MIALNLSCRGAVILIPRRVIFNAVAVYDSRCLSHPAPAVPVNSIAVDHQARPHTMTTEQPSGAIAVQSASSIKATWSRFTFLDGIVLVAACSLGIGLATNSIESEFPRGTWTGHLVWAASS